MKSSAYPYTRHLVAAGVLSLAGQATAIAFMIRTGPFSTLAFMTFGVGMIGLGIALFGYVMFREVHGRMESVREKNFREGEFIFRQGDAGDSVYVVKSGEVEVIREAAEGGSAVVARLGQGEYFGEMALLNDAPRSASVRAATDVTVLSIARRDFDRLFASVPAFKASIEAAMATRTG